MPVDSGQIFGGVLFPAPGWTKLARINGILTPIDSGQIQVANSFRYTHYAPCPPTGPKQKTLHARGTNEITFAISGELTSEAAGLLDFLNPAARGYVFPVTISQHDYGDTIPVCYLDTASFSGDAKGLVRFSITGRAISDIVTGGALSSLGYWHPIPAWSSGNEYVRSWTVTHQVPLTPAWANSQYPWPAYYRPGESEYTLSASTVLGVQKYDQLNLGVGAFQISGVAQTIAEDFSGDDPVTSRVDATNVNIAAGAYTPGGFVLGNGGLPAAWPDGV